MTETRSLSLRELIADNQRLLVDVLTEIEQHDNQPWTVPVVRALKAFGRDFGRIRDQVLTDAERSTSPLSLKLLELRDGLSHERPEVRELYRKQGLEILQQAADALAERSPSPAALDAAGLIDILDEHCYKTEDIVRSFRAMAKRMSNLQMTCQNAGISVGLDGTRNDLAVERGTALPQETDDQTRASRALEPEQGRASRPLSPPSAMGRDYPVAHDCRNGKMKPYGAFLCSVCMGRGAKDYAAWELVERIRELKELYEANHG